MNPLKKSPLRSPRFAVLLKPALLLLLALLSGCEVTLLNGQDPSQLSSNRLIGTSPAPDAHFGDAYYPYHPGYAYRPDYPMGLLKPQYPYRPDYPRSPYNPAQDWSNPYYPYYPAHHGPDEAGPNFPYYPYYPYYPAARQVSGPAPFCLPGYEAHLYGNDGGSRPSYLCIPRADAGYAYYPG